MQILQKAGYGGCKRWSAVQAVAEDCITLEQFNRDGVLTLSVSAGAFFCVVLQWKYHGDVWLKEGIRQPCQRRRNVKDPNTAKQHVWDEECGFITASRVAHYRNLALLHGPWAFNQPDHSYYNDKDKYVTNIYLQRASHVKWFWPSELSQFCVGNWYTMTQADQVPSVFHLHCHPPSYIR